MTKKVLVTYQCFDYCTTRLLFFPFNSPRVGDKTLRGDTAGTTHSNWPKGYSTLNNIRNKTWRFGHCSDTSWALVYLWEIMRECLCITCRVFLFTYWTTFILTNEFSFAFSIVSPALLLVWLSDWGSVWVPVAGLRSIQQNLINQSSQDTCKMCV